MTRATEIAVVILAALALIVLAVSLAHAEDDMGIWLPRAEAAQLFAIAAEAPRLAEKIAQLERAVATANARAEALEKLSALDREMLTRQERLTALADEERDIWKGKAERAEQDAGKGARWLRCRANAGALALIGLGVGSVAPGVGNVLGAAVGGLAGCVAGLLGMP